MFLLNMVIPTHSGTVTLATCSDMVYTCNVVSVYLYCNLYNHYVEKTLKMKKGVGMALAEKVMKQSI